MKAMYVCDVKSNIEMVYSEEARSFLKKSFELSDTVYEKSEIPENCDAEYIFSTWGFPVFTEEEIEKYFPRLKVVFYGAGSVQYFARPFLNKNIKVLSAWLANGVPVAEYTAAQIILANKGFYNASRICKSKDGYKKAYDYCHSFSGTYDTNVGILGVGAIGSMVAERLKGYNINVYAYDPYLTDEKASKLGVIKADLDYIFENCQTISNHIANIPQTVGMLDYKLFSKMKDNAVFINTGRGAQVVEKDLQRALYEKPNRCAVLDVTVNEPCDDGSDFYKLDNVFLTPHIAGSFGNECKRMGDYMTDEAKRMLSGDSFKYSVTKKMLETMA